MIAITGGIMTQVGGATLLEVLGTTAERGTGTQTGRAIEEKEVAAAPVTIGGIIIPLAIMTIIALLRGVIRGIGRGAGIMTLTRENAKGHQAVAIIATTERAVIVQESGLLSGIPTVLRTFPLLRDLRSLSAEPRGSKNTSVFRR